MVSFIDCHLSLRRCSPFNGGKFEGWGTSFCWWPNRIGYLDELSEQRRYRHMKKRMRISLIAF